MGLHTLRERSAQCWVVDLLGTRLRALLPITKNLGCACVAVRVEHAIAGQIKLEGVIEPRPRMAGEDREHALDLRHCSIVLPAPQGLRYASAGRFYERVVRRLPRPYSSAHQGRHHEYSSTDVRWQVGIGA
jgi:hypothetical protein